MNGKQESFEKVFITIKEEHAFDATLSEPIKETMDDFENHQAHSLTTFKAKREFQISPNKVMFFNYIHDVPESQSSEVKASDLLGNLQDLNVIKQEVTETEDIIPKAELLTEYIDLPSIKSNVGFLDEPSTSNNSQYTRGKIKYEDLKKKFNCYKNYSSSYSRLNQFNANFWKCWQACEFCGHFYNTFNYIGHYFIHFVKTHATNLLNCKTNKPSSLKKYGKTRSKYYKRNRFVLKKSTAYTGLKAFKYICFKEFTGKDKLKVHSKTHTGEKPYKCYTCSKQFTHKNSLNYHSRIHTGDKLFKCNICLKQFTQKFNLNAHLKIHNGEKPYKCNTCLKQFIQKNNLNAHLKIHTGEKPFKCKTCLKQFVHKSKLNRHLPIHTGEKPYKCNICLKQFTQKVTLSAHLKMHTGEKPYKCYICSKQFSQKSGINYHLSTHTGAKPYKCNICSKQFTHNCHLIVHLKIHTGEKPYECNTCSKQFSSKSGLNYHLTIHTGEKPYKCNICSKQFAHKGHLNVHLKMCTGKKPF